MCTKLFVVFGCLVASATSARIVRHTANTSDIPVVSDFFEAVSKHLKEVENTVVKRFEVENIEQLEQKALNRGKELTTQLDAWTNDIRNRTQEIRENAVVKKVQASVDKAIENFLVKHSEIAAEIRRFIEKTHKTTEEFLTKIKNWESEEATKIKEFSRKVLNSAATALENLAERIEANPQV